MIRTRSLSGAYLMNNGDFLLLKRFAEREFYPGVWGAVGGHVEPREMNDPQSACLREIHEETGIAESDIENLSLRYIVLRRAEDEIRLNYIFFGDVKTRGFTDTEEGRLHWLRGDGLLGRPMSAMTEATLRRYLEYGPEKHVLVGILNGSGKQGMQWLPLESWEGL
jgi:8-oxo-dGTP diphosphatase